jgi:hypothetical protein
MHISVGVFRKETAGRADFDKERHIEFNDVINFRRKPLRIAGQKSNNWPTYKKAI